MEISQRALFLTALMVAFDMPEHLAKAEANHFLTVERDKLSELDWQKPYNLYEGEDIKKLKDIIAVGERVVLHSDSIYKTLAFTIGSNALALMYMPEGSGLFIHFEEWINKWSDGAKGKIYTAYFKANFNKYYEAVN